MFFYQLIYLLIDHSFKLLDPCFNPQRSHASFAHDPTTKMHTKIHFLAVNQSMAPVIENFAGIMCHYSRIIHVYCDYERFNGCFTGH